jgi:branched-chain amino acid transport system ATP-binding protein
MLAIARTLMGSPTCLLLDEPSEGLAPLVVRAIQSRIQIMKDEGITLLLSEQNLKFAAAVSDRAFVIEKGQIRAQGLMAEIVADEEIRRTYLAI